MKLNLKTSPVTFNETAHIYTLNGKELQGITGMLRRQLFPNKYDGVDPATLSEAAEYGSMVHAAIEAADTFGGASKDPNVTAYRGLVEALGLERETNEYLVSDEENYASSIDVVFSDGSIADIKTTSSLDKEWLSWQLSIYAYLMEKQNPGLEVPKLFAIWLPKPRCGSPKIMEVPRKSSAEVMALLDADANGEQYAGSPTGIDDELMREVLRIRNLKADLEERDKAARAKLRQIMAASGSNGLKTPFFSVSLTPESTAERFDSKRFKKENAELYKSYVTPTQVAERMTIKFSQI